MTPVRLLRITLPLALIALILGLVLKKSPDSPATPAVGLTKAEPPAVPIPPTPLEMAAVAPSSTVTPSEPLYQPGHFPGVSTRHVPGPDPQAANGPPAHVPHEVTLPSGEKLILTLTDERDAIPLMPPPAR